MTAPLTDAEFARIVEWAMQVDGDGAEDVHRLANDALNSREALDEARAEIKRLRGALEELLIVQNGPPLIREQAQWSAAVAKAEAALTPKEPQP